MHIRKLEIHGFKSFPDRVVFHFSEGISGVVGPNGCGKSNVLDAIKWCIGEQSPKELRGSAMEDIVFNGSEDRSPMNISEVSMTFVAGDRPFSGEWARFDEVRISRRLTREKGSEYRINQQRVRLRDVGELFLDTGVGSRFYSFIEQGRIGSVVAASPQERRGLVEEAAGTSRFKARRAETIRRLDATLQNLERSVHVVEELEQRLRQVGQQVDRAARFRRLRALAQQANLLLALGRYSGLMADRRVLSRDRRAAQLELEQRQRAEQRAASDLRRDREQAEVVERVVGALRDEAAELEASRRELESARQYQDRERGDLEARAQRLAAEVSQAQARIQQTSVELERCEQRVQESRDQESDAKAEVTEQRARTEAVVGRLAGLRAVREQRRREHVDQRGAFERARVRLESLQRQDRQLREDLQGQQREVGTVRSEAERLSKARVEAEALQVEGQARLAQTETDKRTAQERVTAQEQAHQQAAQRRAVADRSVLDAERAHAVARAKAESLEELHARHEGLTDASRRVLKRVPGSFAVAEELEVDESLLEPVATALGEHADVVAVETPQQLEAAIQAAGQGSAWVLLLPSGAQPAAHGLASQVGGTERGRSALGLLLGHCQLVPDVSAALDWVAQEQHGSAVTPSGLLVALPGLVRVGRGSGPATSVLGRRRALREAGALRDELVASLGAAKRARDALAEAEAASRQQRDELRRELGERQREHQRAQLEATGMEHRVRACRDAEGRQLRLLSDLEQRTGQQQGRAQALEEELQQAGAARKQAEAGAAAAAQALATAEAASRDVADEHASAAAEQGRLREELVACSGRVAAAEQARSAAERALQQAREVVVRAQEESERVAVRKVELGDQVVETERGIDRVAAKQEKVSGKLAHEQRNLTEARRRVSRAEDKQTEAREAREAAAGRLQKLELELQDARTRIDLLKKQAEEDLGISLPAQLDRLDKNGQLIIPHGLEDEGRLPLELHRLPAVEVLVVEPRHLDDAAYLQEWSDRLDRTRKRLEKLGDVNLTAVEEYLELQARHEDLTAQRQDLEASVAEIRGALARINRTCRDRFRTTFDEVNGHFNSVYERLTQGGKARLVLTDEEDLLETGVDIVAQPPGKRLLNLSLLSGGERALVALAVVFALFQVRPSPFCILDEVDAPLDEGNGARFNDLLRDMARQSQFIVITHNKKTIECADTLYGVTMQDAGVSKLVTVRVH
jgi:chromosome segregation protein